MATETITVPTPATAEMRQEAMTLTVALLARLPLPLTAADAADFAACLFNEVLRALSGAGIHREEVGCRDDAR